MLTWSEHGAGEMLWAREMQARLTNAVWALAGGAWRAFVAGDPRIWGTDPWQGVAVRVGAGETCWAEASGTGSHPWGSNLTVREARVSLPAPTPPPGNQSWVQGWVADRSWIRKHHGHTTEIMQQIIKPKRTSVQ